MTNELSLGSLPVEVLRARIGETVVTQELGGDILMGKLVRVNVEMFDGKLRAFSIVVHENGRDVIWPTQWRQAVFA